MVERLNEIRNNLDKLLAENTDITSIGIVKLADIVKNLKDYKKEADDIFNSYNQSVFDGKSLEEIEYDEDELDSIFSAKKYISDKTLEVTYKYDIEFKNKVNLYNQKNDEIESAKLEIERNEAQIENCKNRIKSLAAYIADDKSSPDLVENYKNEKESLEKTIAICNSSIFILNSRIEKYKKQQQALLNGGDYILEDPLSKNADKEIDKEKADDQELDDDMGIVPPISDEEKKLTSEEPENSDDLTIDELEKGDGITPLPLSPEPTSEPELEEPEKGDGITPLPLPPEPTSEPELEEPEKGDGITPLPLPPEPELEAENDEEDKEKVAPVLVNETAQPKPTLLQKIGNIIKKGILYLGGLSAIILTADHFINHHDIAEIEEQEDEDLDQDESQDLNQSQDQDQSQIQDQENNPSLTPGGNNNTPTTNPSNPGGDNNNNSSDNNSGNDDKEEQEDQIFNDNTTFPIELGSGEVAYNSETGVEVTKDGSAYLHNEDGSTTNQEDRDLDVTDHDTSVVVEEDLYPDINPPVNSPSLDEQIAAVPETGQEQTYQEAVTNDNLTQGEQDNLDSALNAFTDFLNDENLTLTP